MSSFAPLPPKATLKPEPFTVSVPQASLDELKTLLSVARIAPLTYENSLEDRRYGVTRDWILKAKKDWETTFDWRSVEKEINAFPQFKVPITTSSSSSPSIVHFMALFSSNPQATPIILLHGWPGDYLEFLSIFKLLSSRYTPDTLPYHLIAPSNAGFGFSSPPPLDRDFGLKDQAEIYNTLMAGLGFGEGYIAQGGDVGSRIARILGKTYESCTAVHLNLCMFGSTSKPAYDAPLQGLTDMEQEGLGRGEDFFVKGSGYNIEQATRPGTLGLALSSSPIALLAWVGEKFLEWTDEDPSIEEILKHISLYWFTDTISTSFTSYRQRFTPDVGGSHDHPNWHLGSKPLGFSSFRKELFPVPESWAAKTGNLVFYRFHEQGGHFAASEKPEVLLKDLEDFVLQVSAKPVP